MDSRHRPPTVAITGADVAPPVPGRYRADLAGRAALAGAEREKMR